MALIDFLFIHWTTSDDHLYRFPFVTIRPHLYSQNQLSSTEEK